MHIGTGARYGLPDRVSTHTYIVEISNISLKTGRRRR